MEAINWEATSTLIGAVLVAIGFNAWCMKLIINDALNKSMITTLKEFVTKDEFDKHIDHCPHGKK